MQSQIRYGSECGVKVAISRMPPGLRMWYVSFALVVKLFAAMCRAKLAEMWVNSAGPHADAMLWVSTTLALTLGDGMHVLMRLVARSSNIWEMCR